MSRPKHAGRPPGAPDSGPPRHPPLFSVILRAFGLVIILGIGGMLGFFGLSILTARPDAEALVTQFSQGSTPLVAANQLAGFYAQQGSWDGVDTLLPRLFATSDSPNLVATPDSPKTGTSVGPSYNYTLIDPTNHVLATNRLDLPLGSAVPTTDRFWRIPIPSKTGEVGALLVDPPMPVSTVRRSAVPSDIMRAFASAGLGLAAVLLGLATLFARRLSRPLGRLTQAAQTLAAGDMSVRVTGGAAREIDALAAAFNAMAAALAQADTQRRQLTADVAHELRTPLSIIRGRLEGMQDGIYEATPAQVSALLDATALLERLIEDLRLLALADAGQLPLYPEPLDVAAVLQTTAAAFAAPAQAAGVTLRVEAAAGLPEVVADPQRVAQVLSNLVSNALRYTAAGGTITLHAGPDPAPGPAGLRLTVADTGTGIAAEDLPHIFDRFWRADRARSRHGGGAGLGLAIARRIVEAHGGRIGAWSAPGQGTAVYFSLPLPLAPAAPVPAGPAVTRRLVRLVSGARAAAGEPPGAGEPIAPPARRTGTD